jgi:HSP20 family protein
MNITRRDPFDFPITTMNRLMNQIWNQENSLSEAVEESLLPLDISEDDKALVVRASVPGLKPEEIDVQVHNGILTIKAERSEENEEKTERYLRRERRVGSFTRSVALPSLVDDDSTQASLESGVLTLRIAKSQAAMPKKIKIGGGQNSREK